MLPQSTDSLRNAICVTNSTHMIIALIKLSAAVLYVLCLCSLWKGVFNRRPVNRKRLAFISLIASTLHFIGALLLVLSEQLINFSLFTSGSLIFAVTSLIVTLSSIRKPVHALLLIIQPICLLLIAISLILEPTKVTSISMGTAMHILFSILAYGVITIAAASAIVMMYASYRLKHKQVGSMGSLMPPLETTEKLLFEMILAGEALLTMSILSGFAFIQDFFGQHLIHKTFFSLLSWIIFATLLAGHHFFGWRGARAMKLTIAGFIMLLLSYVGSKLVLELILV